MSDLEQLLRTTMHDTPDGGPLPDRLLPGTLRRHAIRTRRRTTAGAVACVAALGLALPLALQGVPTASVSPAAPTSTSTATSTATTAPTTAPTATPTPSVTRDGRAHAPLVLSVRGWGLAYVVDDEPVEGGPYRLTVDYTSKHGEKGLVVSGPGFAYRAEPQGVVWMPFVPDSRVILAPQGGGKPATLLVEPRAQWPLLDDLVIARPTAPCGGGDELVLTFRPGAAHTGRLTLTSNGRRADGSKGATVRRTTRFGPGDLRVGPDGLTTLRAPWPCGPQVPTGTSREEWAVDLELRSATGLALSSSF